MIIPTVVNNYLMLHIFVYLNDYPQRLLIFYNCKSGIH